MNSSALSCVAVARACPPTAPDPILLVPPPPPSPGPNAAGRRHAPRRSPRPLRAYVASQQAVALGPAARRRRTPPRLDRREVHQGRRRQAGMGPPPGPRLPVPAMPTDRRAGGRRAMRRPRRRRAARGRRPGQCAPRHLTHQGFFSYL